MTYDMVAILLSFMVDIYICQPHVHPSQLHIQAQLHKNPSLD